ncbi:hypothetical protein C2S53_012613 [Perilla frutescens var. hirtella]|uniref:Pectinesterase inhibitor domain-containing protein n=1 Tax=Perilla frutescens var. hirtella TaxID=608512 RepID=A0AAD4JL53_PERFH|nr:hypothetical protein C2S53_012613 [Perilla frutescens var. hirtella]
MSCTLCFLVSVVVLFLSISPSVSVDRIDPATQSRINHVCQKSYDYYLCRDIFNNNLHSNVTDFKGLTQIALSRTLIYTSDTFIFIKRSESSETNTTQRDLYKICDAGYGLLLNQFQEASLEFAKNDIRSMLFDISNCERFVNDCESVLGFKVPALHDKNYHTKVLVKMSNVSVPQDMSESDFDLHTITFGPISKNYIKCDPIKLELLFLVPQFKRLFDGLTESCLHVTHRFLRYHPINELDFFLKSIGLNCDKNGIARDVLPKNSFFISDWGCFYVVLLLGKVGFMNLDDGLALPSMINEFLQIEPPID